VIKNTLDSYYQFDYNYDVKWNKTKLDFEQLRKEIRLMSNRSQLHRLLEDELTKLDHWKQRARGNPKKANSLIKNRRI
jgi:hypothetical protein